MNYNRKGFPNGKPFDYMQEMEGERVFFLLKEESSAVQALVLSHLKPKVAADVINQMELSAKTEVVRRLATLKKIDPEVLRRVDQAMQEKVKNSQIFFLSWKQYFLKPVTAAPTLPETIFGSCGTK